MLIQLTPIHVIDSSKIIEASRCGNYTFLELIGDRASGLHQIWDEDKSVWNAIEAAALRATGENQ